MKLLALESSAKAASCAVLEDGEAITSAWQATGLTHSRTLLPMVQNLLADSGHGLGDGCPGCGGGARVVYRAADWHCHCERAGLGGG